MFMQRILGGISLLKLSLLLPPKRSGRLGFGPIGHRLITFYQIPKESQGFYKNSVLLQ